MVADTLTGIFLAAVTSSPRPDQFMRHDGHDWEPISSERALADVEALALALRELGVARGDRVALLSETRYEWAIADLAILGLGAVTVTIYPTLTAAQCRALFENAQPCVVVVSTLAQLEKARTASAGMTCVHARVCMDPLPPNAAAGEHAVHALLARGETLRRAEPGAYRAMAGAVRPDDLATIIYTSGTTGEPKGAMLTHGNIASNVSSSLEVFTYEATDRCLSILPLSHIFERMGGFYAILACGAGIAYSRNFDTIAADLLATQPTILVAVPRVYEKFYARVMDGARAHPAPVRALFRWALTLGRERARAHYAWRKPGTLTALQAPIADRLVFAAIRARLGGRLRFCISGSAPLAPEVAEFFYAIGIPIIEGYGLTETSPVITINSLGRERLGTVGPPIPGVEVKIGEQGEILARGPGIMRGYYRNEAATNEALRDGWFHTGDIGHLDSDGYLVITDRLKDLLVLAAGKKVAPQPIEAKLKRSEWISECVLLGDRRPYVVCLIVPNFARLEAEAKTRGWPSGSHRELIERPDVVALFQAEVDKVNAELAPFEQIKRIALLDRELTQEAGELTPSLKVKRRAVTENFTALIQELYAGHAGPSQPLA